ncbi:MAG: flagellar biosynthesis anti-sigma factor FlgM [Bryobacterales bacterium]|nr:flagellar biosynthesis anti-sigma factor FlgM [Bryobacterales bacterium]
MKVNDSNTGHVGSAQYESTRAADGVRSGSRDRGSVSSRGSDGDDVRLSDLAGLLKTASGNPAERNQKTQQLTELVRSGNYQVDAGDLSRRLVDEMLGKNPL